MRVITGIGGDIARKGRGCVERCRLAEYRFPGRNDCADHAGSVVGPDVGKIDFDLSALLIG